MAKKSKSYKRNRLVIILTIISLISIFIIYTYINANTSTACNAMCGSTGGTCTEPIISLNNTASCAVGTYIEPDCCCLCII